ncbi:MAG: carboxypeptidase-like regulatory domain-containing protein, partial [Saprospiraceae bacterium]|nr:carboxypeptidase-like regulatory domain-containing protein [Saprospiraceae bacterium]
TAILAYKYKLIEAILEDGRMVYKIEVIPRKNSNSTCKGYIYINDELWNINRIEVEFYKGGLKFYDAFQLKQHYQQIKDSLWIPYRQEFIYETKQGNKQTFKGNTTIFYKDFQKGVVFPERFFRNEVAVTTKEAYERDSSYWQQVRTEPFERKHPENGSFSR